MSAGLLVSMVFGGLLALGLAALVVRLFPAQHVQLDDAFARITPDAAATTSTTAPSSDATRADRLGAWAMRTLPPALWVRTPYKELALLRIPITQFYAAKLVHAAAGLLAVPVLTLVFNTLGVRLPVTIPAVATLGLAGLLFFFPNIQAVDNARAARAEFRRAIAVYIDLVAVERHNGTGVRQAMETATEVTDSWVFDRIGEELRRTHWSGTPPWDALQKMSADLDLPELNDFADIMRLSATEGAAAYETLRARAASLRSAALSDDLTAANAVGERMTAPGSVLGLIFMAALIAPAILRIATDT